MANAPQLEIVKRDGTAPDLIGDSDAMREVRSLIGLVAASDASVLVTGPSGSGKELVARAIHAASRRAAHAFSAMNCGAVPADLLESELFGHERGSFTGAVAQVKGRFESTSGGTLFLDEIGDMPGVMQVKLLRVLEEKTVTRVGSRAPIPVDTRIVSATHRDIESAIRQQNFREDLFYRLAVFPIHLPSLAERMEDVPQLLAYFLDSGDYFTPTLVEMREKSAGGTGPLGGDSITARDNYPHKAAQTGSKGITIPKDATGGPSEGAGDRSADRRRFESLKRKLIERINKDASLKRRLKNIRFTETREGLRIDLVDEADFAMFNLATADLLPDARRLMGEVAMVIAGVPNDVIVRGHTDALPYAAGRTTNNWTLSTLRAEATRQALHRSGVSEMRFARIEGVSDREPYVPADRYDPRNRRMSITLGWAKPGQAQAMPTAAAAR